MKATFVITGLATGGAEIMLQKVLERMTRLRVGRVVALRSGGELEDRFRASGFDVVGLDMKPGVPDPRAVWRLAHVLRKDGADVVSTWMYHADIVGGLAARLAGLPVVWSLRNSTLSPDATKLSTRAVVRACAALSHMVPAAIISCSYRARDVHIRLGYKASKFRVIPNGFDIGRFAPSNEARLAVRRELGISDDAPLVGLVARFDPQKNHAGFLEAAQSIHQQRPDVRFVMVGAGVTRDNPALTGDIRDRGLSGVVALLGRREDMPQLMAALDVLVSSSYGEAFPNVLGEAMACGVPCVVTDVGDSAAIVGDTGVVVSPGDMRSLAEGVLRILSLPAAGREALGRHARHRVATQFDIGAVVRQYEAVFAEAVQTRTRQ